VWTWQVADAALPVLSENPIQLGSRIVE
jgi:hypothetical protein